MMNRAENVNNSYFDSSYKHIWRALNPEGLTKAETNFLVAYNDLKPGDRVLDLMCGYGRNAIALARLGVRVVAVDNLGEYIEEIKLTSANEHLAIDAIRADVINFTPPDGFDLA